MAYRKVSSDDDIGEFWHEEGSDKVTMVVNTDDIQRLCYEHQKEDGFTPDRRARRIAHIELNLVKFLALEMKDSDAYSFLYEHDQKAMMRMIIRYPHFFKACSGGI